MDAYAEAINEHLVYPSEGKRPIPGLAPGVPVAVVEAKDNHHTVGHGLQQALDYAEILNIPSAYSSNGDAFASHNRLVISPWSATSLRPTRLP